MKTVKQELKDNPSASALEFTVHHPFEDGPFHGQTHQKVSFTGLVSREIAEVVAALPTNEAVRRAVHKIAEEILGIRRPDPDKVAKALGAERRGKVPTGSGAFAAARVAHNLPRGVKRS